MALYSDTTAIRIPVEVVVALIANVFGNRSLHLSSFSSISASLQLFNTFSGWDTNSIRKQVKLEVLTDINEQTNFICSVKHYKLAEWL